MLNLRLIISNFLNIFMPMHKGRKIRLTSTSQVLEALGGRAQAANFLRVGQSQVSNMLKHGIPASHHKRIELVLNHMGYEIDHERVFGYTLESLLERIEEGNEQKIAAEMHAA